MVYLNTKLTGEDYEVLGNMMQYESGIREVYSELVDKLFTSQYTALIESHGENVGFVLGSYDNLENILFVDMGIIEKYRNQGLGTLALQKLSHEYAGNDYLIGEVKLNNIPALGCASLVGDLIMNNGLYNYYLLSHNIDNFKQSDTYDKFIDYEVNYKAKQREFKLFK